MAEYKPGKYRLADFGTEVIVLCGKKKLTVFYEAASAIHVMDPFEFEGAEYLGPAVIGAEDELAGCAMKGAMASRIVELEEERDEYRSKWDEAVEETRRLQQEVNDQKATSGKLACKWGEASSEIARLQTVVHEVTRERDEYRRKWQGSVEKAINETRRLQEETENARGSRDNWKCSAEQMKYDRDKKARQVDRLRHEIATLKDEVEKRTYQIVELTGKVDDAEALLEVRSVDADGIEWYRFGSVTVAVRNGKEPIAQKASSGMWWAALGKSISVHYSTRAQAEAWCRQQLVPVEEWRPATVEDVAGKPECRCRDEEYEDWWNGELLCHEPRCPGGEWIALTPSHEVLPFKICEVRK